MGIQTTSALKASIKRGQKWAVQQQDLPVDVSHVVWGMIQQGSLGTQFLASLNVPLNELKAYIKTNRQEQEQEPSKPSIFQKFKQKRDGQKNKVSKDLSALLENAAGMAAHYGDSYLSSEVVLVTLFGTEDNALAQWLREYASPHQAEQKLRQIRASGGTIQSEAEREFPYLNQFGKNLTAEANKGHMDPIIGRDKEIGLMVNTLSQRTKNNPVLVGEAGVGKTALAEGLAQRIVKGQVPDKLLGKQIISLDMQTLLSGAKYQGELQKRLQHIIKEVKSANGQVILLIDEVHTIVGAGSNGSGDVSNALKPELARGEVAIIGATTNDEYKQYIEPDAALARRFQPVAVAEPTLDDATHILRGLKDGFERFHHVRIHDNALSAAVELSDRYIGDRYLPDKAIDMIDQACSEVNVQKDSVPEPLNELKNTVLQLNVRLDALKKETDPASREQAEEVIQKLNKAKKEGRALNERWKREKQALDAISEVRDKLVVARKRLAAAKEAYDKDKVSKLQSDIIPTLENRLDQMTKRFDQQTGGKALMSESVGEEEVASVIAAKTGIPLNKLMADDKSKLLNMDQVLKERVVGQDEAVEAVANTVIRSRVGIQSPDRPLGSFLFLGPSGTGKTELAKALASQLFDTEDAMIRIDMSEYMEKHSVNRLIGAPPGYVGYDQGGQLTEAVRQQPYSVILFDEVEKAHSAIFDALLQLLDDGRVTDGKGNIVDFTQTLVILTSNLGSSTMMEDQSALDGKGYATTTRSHVRNVVENHFRPEFLNRIDEQLLFNPLGANVSGMIVQKQLERFTKRMAEQRYRIQYTKRLVQWVAEKAYDPRYGARPFNRFIQQQIEVPFSKAVLAGEVIQGRPIRIDVGREGRVVFQTKAKHPATQ